MWARRELRNKCRIRIYRIRQLLVVLDGRWKSTVSRTFGSKLKTVRFWRPSVGVICTSTTLHTVRLRLGSPSGKTAVQIVQKALPVHESTVWTRKKSAPASLFHTLWCIVGGTIGGSVAQFFKIPKDTSPNRKLPAPRANVNPDVDVSALLVHFYHHFEDSWSYPDKGHLRISLWFGLIRRWNAML